MTAEIAAEFTAQAAVGRGPRNPPPGWHPAVDPDQLVRFIKPAAQQAAVSAGGVATFDMDGPKTGYQWTVRRVAVADAASLANTVAGAGGIFSGQPVPGLITTSNLEVPIPALPFGDTYGSDQIVLQYGEHLLVQVTGATPGQLLICTISYQLYRPGAVVSDVQV